MSLWCDKYRPRSFKELDYGSKQSSQLQRMVKEGDFPHLLIWGANGAGKVQLIFHFVESSRVFKFKLRPMGSREFDFEGYLFSIMNKNSCIL